MILVKLERQQGFTLIELVIAVAIFLVISTVTVTAFVKFLDIRERIVDQQKRLSQLQKTFLFMANDVRYAVNRAGKDSYGDIVKMSLQLDNKGTVIELTSAYPDLTLNGLAVPRKIVWEIDEKLLIRKQFPVMDPDGDTQFIRQNMLEGVESVDVLVSQIENQKSNESKRWKEEGKLPDLFDIKIKLENDQVHQRAFQVNGN